MGRASWTFHTLAFVLTVGLLIASCAMPVGRQGIALSALQRQTLTSQISPPAAPNVIPTARGQATYSTLPLYFEANGGQTDERVHFLARGSGYSLFLTATEAVLVLRNAEHGTRNAESKKLKSSFSDHHSSFNIQTVLRMKLVGVNPVPQVAGLEDLPGKVNYFRGNEPTRWRSNIPTYAKVKYEEVYPGIDLVYYGNQQQLEYDFIVAPGADPHVIRLAFEGIVGAHGRAPLWIDTQGDLILQTASGEVRFHAPRIYQESNGSRHPISGRYVLFGRETPDSGLGTQEVGFEGAAYDTNKPLVIDPVLSYSTYLGGSEEDGGSGIAVDAEGNTYVTGLTFSPDFPQTSTVQPTLSGTSDAFVAKVDPTGSVLLYATYLGGSGDERGSSLTLDSSGSIYVTGATRSVDFPTAQPLQPTFGSVPFLNTFGNDAFVTKLDPTGAALVYSTYLGGNDNDEGYSIAVDTFDNAYVTGVTGSTDFPTLHPFQAALGSGPCGPIGASTQCPDAFVTKLNATGTALIYSTYLGGSDDDFGFAIAVAADGTVALTGLTISPDFPLAAPLRPTLQGYQDAFVTKLNPSGTALIYSTYLGGSSSEDGTAIALDTAGNAYVTGSTSSPDFPLATPLQPTLQGYQDAFVTKLNPSGTALIYSTYLGGSSSEGGAGIALDMASNVYVTGATYSLDFPVARPFQRHGGDRSCVVSPRFPLRCPDAFVTKMDASGRTLVYSTYLGGDHSDSGSALAVDSAGTAYVTGSTTSSTFPTENAFQLGCVNGEGECFSDAFVVKITDAPDVWAFFESPEPGPVAGITLIRGWAFATDPEAPITRIELFIDGVRVGDIPCCTERGDVQAAFPQFPADQTLQSGWGTTFNWGTLSPGSHTVRINIRGSAGELFFTETRTVTVVQPGDFEFVDQFSLVGATVSIEGDELVVNEVVVRDKATQQQRQINTRFRWFTSLQSFGMVQAETVAELSFWRRSFPSLFASLPRWFSGGPAVAKAQEGENPNAVIFALENPQDGQPVSGVTIIRGWAVPEGVFFFVPIRLLLDDEVSGTVPCCSARADVAAVFSENPRALNSGWGITFNYGTLTPGVHMVGVEIESRIPGRNFISITRRTHTVQVIRIGGFEFVDMFDLSSAQARIEGEEIVLSGMMVRDKASQQTKILDARLRWFENAQALGIVASSE